MSKTFIRAVYYYACEPSHIPPQQASAIHHTVRTTVAATQLLSKAARRRGGGAAVPYCPIGVNHHLGQCKKQDEVLLMMTAAIQERSRDYANKRNVVQKKYFTNEYLHRNRGSHNLVGYILPREVFAFVRTDLAASGLWRQSEGLRLTDLQEDEQDQEMDTCLPLT